MSHRKQKAQENKRVISLDHDINDIVEKVFTVDHDKKLLTENCYPISYYKIGSTFIDKAPQGTVFPYTGTIPEGYFKVLCNDKPGTTGRSRWFIVAQEILFLDNKEYSNYRVAISARNSAGSEKRGQQVYIYSPNVLFNDARYCVAGFDTYQEAENFTRWLETDIIRTLLFSSSRRIKNFGVNVPMLDSYKKSEYIDFSQDINKQLAERYLLNEKDLITTKKIVNSLGDFHQTI